MCLHGRRGREPRLRLSYLIQHLPQHIDRLTTQLIQLWMLDWSRNIRILKSAALLLSASSLCLTTSPHKVPLDLYGGIPCKGSGVLCKDTEELLFLIPLPYLPEASFLPLPSLLLTMLC